MLFHLVRKVKMLWLLLLPVVFFLVYANVLDARNISTYKDTISDSKPGELSNHTLSFTLDSNIAAGGYLELTPPADFEILATSTFEVRNVELIVNGTSRNASSALSAVNDQVVITPGTPGSIRYNLNTTTGISDGDSVVFKVGNHTSNSNVASVSYSTTTGTTTTPGDIGIQNSSTTGMKRMQLRTGGADAPTYADFVLFLIEGVSIADVDTTEQIPPRRFNGAPTSTVGGTTVNVEISLETDEFADCRYSTTASTSFAAMTDVFESTGLIVHRQEVAVENSTTYTFYVRCIDDEGNFNTDDYLITFDVADEPVGTPNTEGEEEGTGTGSGDSGSGSGGGDGGTSGSSDGGSSSGGSSSGSGGSGGGSGGNTGPGSPNTSGGGQESTEGAYESGDATVIINGSAYPRSDIVVLVDGQRARTGKSRSDGTFSVTLDAIARGVYTFGIYAEDSNSIKSTTFSTTFSVQGARTSNLSNVNIMPSVLVNPDPVEIGETLIISGYSIPDSEVTIENVKDGNSISLKTFTTNSDSSGNWSIEVDTAGFSAGTYKARAKSDQVDGDDDTEFSDYTYYGVGQEADVQINADLNRDGDVNLIDFSILLFWWGTPGGDSDPPADINQDGSVSLTDFSILLFNWTG